ncbi:hypothetical protein BHM03_00053117 [Ensete ventricosum]|nr:hypothetical protein BHM03_00053117 [Ensete ventricosum]
MESVEAVVAHIQGLSGSQEEVAHLHSLLKQSEDALRSQAARLGAFLHQLDPSVHRLYGPVQPRLHAYVLDQSLIEPYSNPSLDQDNSQ